MRNLLSLTLLAASLCAAEGLSWTDRNTDTLCNEEVAFVCSGAYMSQSVIYIDDKTGEKIYLLIIELDLYPSAPDNVADNTMDIIIVTETQDHVKHTTSRRWVPIETKIEPYRNGGTRQSRSCSVSVESVGQGIIAVLSIDGYEKQPDILRKIVSYYRFR